MGENLLSQERSPYLTQHKNNPVWWHPWGDEAFELARREDKPIFLSIGYSTCYWCHVMERDSFEQQAVADILNEHFVSIKVDREELPDVDQIYMDVVVGIHGHGGWPLSVFLTPARQPFWGGTFFYRDAFCKILLALSDAWRRDRERVMVSSEELTHYLRDKQAIPGGRIFDQGIVTQAVDKLLASFDPTDGGFGAAPKFPPSQQLHLLMQASLTSDNSALSKAIQTTLSSMAYGGIFDHLGGGFHRYSVDAQWLIPHFEKMLYDNALLVPVYLDGFLKTGDNCYRDVAERTLEYLLCDMRDKGGAFYAAEDAGEVDREGEFYVWTPPEIRAAIQEAGVDRFLSLYGVTEEGNFENGTSVLHLAQPKSWVESREAAVVQARKMLLHNRGRRARPAQDVKIITGWNGLAITALCRGYQVLRDERYRVAGLECAGFVRSFLHAGETLLRRYCLGEARFNATLEDYAYLTEGILQLYSSTGNSEWLRYAMRLQDEQHERLWLASAQAYSTSASLGNITQICEWHDGATPSPNGTSLHNLLILSALTGEPRFSQRAEALEAGIPAEITAHPSAYARTVRAILARLTGSQVCVVSPEEAGAQPPTELFELWSRFLPLTTFAWRSGGSEPLGVVHNKGSIHGKTAIYLCENKSCGNPVVDVNGAVEVCLRTSTIKGT